MNKLHKAIAKALTGAALAIVSTHASALDTFQGQLDYNGVASSLSGVILPQGWNGGNNGNFGWPHNSDWFTLQVQGNGAGNLDIRVSADVAGVQPAFTVWSTGTSSFNTNLQPPIMAFNQIGNNDWQTGATFVGYANNYLGDGQFGAGPDYTGADPGFVSRHAPALPGVLALTLSAGGLNSAGLVIPNVAAGSWFLVNVGGSGGSAGAYTLSVSPAAVPIPAAVWLFASALGGMGLFGRRKRKAL